ARGQHAAVWGDDVGREEVVAGEPVLAHQPPDPAAQREAGDTGARDEAAGGGEAERLRFLVELAPDDAALGAGRLRARVDPDSLHRRQVEDEAVVAGAEAGDVVAAAAYGDDEVVLTGEAEAGDHV